MSIYKFKTVPASEKNKLIKFIDEHWKKGHALVKAGALLDFQHYNASSDSYHFIAAENTETGEYDALVGYIPLSQYDDKTIEILKENGCKLGMTTIVDTADLSNKEDGVIYKLPRLDTNDLPKDANAPVNEWYNK